MRSSCAGDRALPAAVGPPWPNGQGAPLLRVRLWVRVPLGVEVEKNLFFWPQNSRRKSTTPCGIQTHNLQIRSLTRCSIAPTGQHLGRAWLPGLGFCLEVKNGMHAPGGTRTPDPGLIRPMLYQTELPELRCPRSGSNQGPSALQSDALPTELHGHS